VQAGVEEEQINEVLNMWQTRCLDKMEGNTAEEDLMACYLAGRSPANYVYGPSYVQCHSQPSKSPQLGNKQFYSMFAEPWKRLSQALTQ